MPKQPKLEDRPEVLHDLRNLVAKALGVPQEAQSRSWPLWTAWLALVVGALFLAFLWWKVLRG
jgi:hypothetical protein